MRNPYYVPTGTFKGPTRFWSHLTMELRLTYDAVTDVAYLTVAGTGPTDILGPALHLEDDAQFAGVVSLDFHVNDGRLVGLEFQSASTCLPPDWLASAERIDGEHLARRIERRISRRLRWDRLQDGERPRTH
jgi:hypothetical protein